MTLWIMMHSPSIEHDYRVFRYEVALVRGVFGSNMWSAKPEWVMATLDLSRMF